MSSALIEKVRNFAESHFADDGSGHDWWHVHRVWNTAKHLADAEGADRTIVEIAALLHDVGGRIRAAPGQPDDAELTEVLEQLRAQLEAIEASSRDLRAQIEIMDAGGRRGGGRRRHGADSGRSRRPP